MARARSRADGTVVEILPDGRERPLVPRSDWSRVDATTEAELAVQAAADDAAAIRAAGAHARGIRHKVGLSQTAFADRIGVSVQTLRRWERGQEAPVGPAKALLRIIEHAPETALWALTENG